MNNFPEKQTDTQQLQRSPSPFHSARLGSRRHPYEGEGAENPYRDASPSKPGPKLDLPRPATSPRNKAFQKTRTNHHKVLLTIAFLCLLVTCLSLAKLTMFLHPRDGKPFYARVPEHLKAVPRERGETGGTSWWKVAMFKAEVDDDPDVETSTTGPERGVPLWWDKQEEVLLHLIL
ncbi:hypothetical protein M407DRAFT_241024 [Tulasnella calospora MUT 4182]|uniref:Uncharacterized protein n=1 Tax=Tulasnella calospora MUT 4182 TaxID=1051891 RepID=A0A0C3QLM1_9AGAM|nr:hypothetical protein M407DRAFT_241024 [Tulasnella calospora MUT 4182]